MTSKSTVFALLLAIGAGISTHALAQTNTVLVRQELKENQQDAHLLETILRQEQAQQIDEQKRADEQIDTVYFVQERSNERQKASLMPKQEVPTTEVPVKASRSNRRAHNIWISSENTPAPPLKVQE